MRPPRISFIGGVYHVTVRCNNREFFFDDDRDFQDFIAILLKAKELYQVWVHAYCLTNNHIHLLICTPDRDTLSAFMQYVNGNFARSYNLRHGRSGRFWGARFHSTVIESETQLFNTMIYIELNMLRCRAVDDPSRWKWSSYHTHACGKSDPVVDLHPIYLQLGESSRKRQQVYRQMVQERIAEKGLARESVLSTGVILGGVSFVRDLVETLGQRISFYKDRKIHPWGDFFCLKKPIPLTGDTG